MFSYNVFACDGENVRECLHNVHACVCVYIYMCVFGACIFAYVCVVCVRARVYIPVSSCVWLRATAMQTRSCDLNW